MINKIIENKHIIGWIFDLDGVITDTAIYHYQAWEQLAKEENLIFNETINDKLRGVSRRASLDIVLNGKTMPEEKILKMLETKNNYYLELLKNLDKDSILPGILPLIEKLKYYGKKTAIASASRNTDYIINKLNLNSLFDGIASGIHVFRAKPEPDVFLHAAGQLNLPVNNCIVIEDAEAGVQGAKIAGFKTIGIGPKERVGEADYLFKTTSLLNPNN